MSYKQEFPDYDGEFFCPKGWEDCSWHNDTMPKAVFYFGICEWEMMFIIWQDYVDENKREFQGEPRYIFQINKGTYTIFEHKTDSLEEIKLLVERFYVMRDKIKSLLDEKINEIFFEMQEELDIQDGGVEPMMALKLDEELDRLTEMVRDILGMQKGE